MRFAVTSDIHADPAALERVFSAIGATNPDEVWRLGDILGLGGTAPQSAVDAVHETCTFVLAGNHDAWVTGALSLNLLALPAQWTSPDSMDTGG